MPNWCIIVKLYVIHKTKGHMVALQSHWDAPGAKPQSLRTTHKKHLKKGQALKQNKEFKILTKAIRVWALHLTQAKFTLQFS